MRRRSFLGLVAGALAAPLALAACKPDAKPPAPPPPLRAEQPVPIGAYAAKMGEAMAEGLDTAGASAFIPTIWSAGVLEAAEFNTVLARLLEDQWEWPLGSSNALHVSRAQHAELLRDDRFVNAGCAGDGSGRVGSVYGVDVYVTNPARPAIVGWGR